jgi:hypothetical protein
VHGIDWTLSTLALRLEQRARELHGPSANRQPRGLSSQVRSLVIDQIAMLYMMWIVSQNACARNYNEPLLRADFMARLKRRLTRNDRSGADPSKHQEQALTHDIEVLAMDLAKQMMDLDLRLERAAEHVARTTAFRSNIIRMTDEIYDGRYIRRRNPRSSD